MHDLSGEFISPARSRDVTVDSRGQNYADAMSNTTKCRKLRLAFMEANQRR